MQEKVKSYSRLAISNNISHLFLDIVIDQNIKTFKPTMMPG